MKMKRCFVLYVVMLMVFAMTGICAGCGTKDVGVGQRTEEQHEETEQQEPEKETTTPAPTSTPEVIPTAQELIEANKGMFDDKIRMTMDFAYGGSDGTEDVEMDIYSVNAFYEDVEYQYSEITVSMMGVSDTSKEELYYVDDETTRLRTEYFYDEDMENWVKSQYAHIDLEEDTNEDESGVTAIDEMENITVKKDGDCFLLQGELSEDAATELMAGMGTDEATISSTTCEFRFDAKTKKVIGAEIVVKFDVQEVEDMSMRMDDFVLTIEVLTAPIDIPEEVLAAESDVDVDINWEIITEDEW